MHISFIIVPLVFALAAGLAIAAGSMRHHTLAASSAQTSSSSLSSPSAKASASASAAARRKGHQHGRVSLMSPTGLSARAVSSKKVSLSWHRPAAHVAVASYVVYRDGTKVGTSKKLSFSDPKVKAGVTYSYRISARSKAGKVSSPSAEAVVTTHATTTSGGGAPKPVPPPAGFPRAANTGYEHAPGYPGHLKNCNNVRIRSNTTYKFCNFTNGMAIGSAHSHPVNVTFIGCRFASNAVVNADVADYGSHVVFSYSTFEPSTVVAGPGPSSPYANPIDYHRGYQYGIDQRYAGSLTIDHGNFWGFAEAVEFGFSSQARPVVISNTWIHNPRAPGSVDHTDGILENYGGVSYMVFHHNSIVGNGNTNALALQGNSPYRHVTITGNYFSGYGYMVNAGQNMRSPGMVFTGNVWGTDFRPVWGPLYGGSMFTTRGLGGRWARNTIRVRAGTKWMSTRNNGLYWWPIDGDPSSSRQVIGHKRDWPGG